MKATCETTAMVLIMCSHITLFATVFSLFLGIVQPATLAAQPDKQGSWVLTKVRILPMTGDAASLAGARITGSNLNATNGFVELAKISEIPADNAWIEVPVKPTEVYRYVKLEAAPSALLTVAELELYASDRKFAGQNFGTDTGKT